MESALESGKCYLMGEPENSDLGMFRDAVLLYCEALRRKQPFHCSAGAETSRLLSWLGIEFEPSGAGQDLSLLELLPQSSGLPNTPLASFREQGYLGRTLFAALLRSSYGPDEEGYFPTQSELGFYFEREQVRPGPVRWDQEYLDECQEFFFEELTPAELLEETLQFLPPEARGGAERFREELEGVAFLVGEQESMLRPLVNLMTALLVGRAGGKELSELLGAVKEWTREAFDSAWNELGQPARDGIAGQILGGVEAESSVVLLACGRRLLEWRSQV